MRKLTALLAAGMVFGASGMAMADTGLNSASATAQTTATVVTPIGITKTADLGFGKVVPGTEIGTVAMDTSSVRAAGGGTTLGNTPGAAAVFTVAGQANATYSIVLPGAAITLSDTASTPNTMTADNFISFPASTGILNGSGSQELKVGGTLHVDTSAKNPAGTYTNTTGLSVIVAYN